MTHTEDQSGRRAIVLLSGGLDSFRRGDDEADGYELYALSIRYGQIMRARLRRRAAGTGTRRRPASRARGRSRGVRWLGPRR